MLGFFAGVATCELVHFAIRYYKSHKAKVDAEVKELVDKVESKLKS